MKKDRNCMMNNPYMQNMQMGVPMNMGYMQAPNMNAFGPMENNIEKELNNIQGQINMLDKRISKLENMMMSSKDNYTTYNNQNYHIM